VVANVDEQEAAMVADAMHPAGDSDGLADIGRAKGSAGMAPVAMHGDSRS
jgi:hypothetical protein